MRFLSHSDPVVAAGAAVKQTSGKRTLLRERPELLKRSERVIPVDPRAASEKRLERISG